MRNTTLCYIIKDNKCLMLHRTKKENDQSHDKWLGIGGKFEDKGKSGGLCSQGDKGGDRPYGHRIQIQGDCHVYIRCVGDGIHHLFTVTGFRGEVSECDEGDLEWIDVGRLLELPMWEGDRIFLNLLASNSPFFSLKLKYEGEKLSLAVLNGKKIGE